MFSKVLWIGVKTDIQLWTNHWIVLFCQTLGPYVLFLYPITPNNRDQQWVIELRIKQIWSLVRLSTHLDFSCLCLVLDSCKHLRRFWFCMVFSDNTRLTLASFRLLAFNRDLVSLCCLVTFFACCSAFSDRWRNTFTYNVEWGLVNWS